MGIAAEAAQGLGVAGPLGNFGDRELLFGGGGLDSGVVIGEGGKLDVEGEFWFLHDQLHRFWFDRSFHILIILSLYVHRRIFPGPSEPAKMLQVTDHHFPTFP
jgi:hypothetical protein